MATTYAVASDLSTIVETDDGFGKFATKLEALNSQIAYLEAERGQINEWLGIAKRRRGRELRRTAQVQS